MAVSSPEAVPKYISGRTSYLRVRLAFHPYPQVIPAVCNGHGFGPPRACSARFTLPMGRSPGFGSVPRDCSPFRTRFRSGSGCRCLNLATPNHSSAHSTKGTPSPPGNPASSDRLEAHGFRLSFTPLVGVLFTVPSRYWFTIGRLSYLALGGGPPSFPPDSACRAVLTLPDHWSDPSSPTGLSPAPVARSSALRLTHRDPSEDRSTPSIADRSTPRSTALARSYADRFGLLPVRSPLLRESSLFLGVLRCFSSPGALPHKRGDGPSRLPGCPIRRSLDRRLPAPPQSISPRGRVLHRRPAPRHPPCAHLPVAPCDATHPARLVPRRDIETSRAVDCLNQVDVLVRSRGRTCRRSVLFSITRSVGPRSADFHRPIHVVKVRSAGGAAGTRTPDLRRARAALSRLSYGPASTRAGGRAWTRTRDLGLIRAAL